MITRRNLLVTTAATAGLAAVTPVATALGAPARRLPGDLFTLGVASGDPLPDSVVLWTRLAPNPLNGGGMPDRRFPVEWEVAEDEAFRRVVRRGTEQATPELGHSVHAEPRGLRPSATYFYRFRAAGQISPIGRTRTAPALRSSPAALALAVVSCQDWQAGYYSAYRGVADEDLDLVVHLGDYIYEYGPQPGVRQHDGPEVDGIASYRNRHALYRTDADLQAAHAAHPFVVTWDDHEVDNNYADDIPENGYVAARNRILGFLDQRRPANPIVLTGDIHSSWVHDLKADFADPGSATLGTEFVGTSISSDFPAPFVAPVVAALPDNPHTRFFDGAFRGYLRCDVTPQQWTSTFRVVDTALIPGAPTRTLATFAVPDGSPGAQPV